MYIYNITLKVENIIAKEWLQWMKDEHIPEVVGTGCFSEARMFQLAEVDEVEGPTYAVQFSAANKADYDLYLQKHANILREKTAKRWGDKVIGFRSLLKIIPLEK